MPGHYKLGINGLTPSEIGLVQTLLQLTAHNRSIHWTCTGQPPWHAILLDDPDDNRLEHDGLAALLPGPGHPTPYVLRLNRASTPLRPGAMNRPIRAEKLLGWLDQVEAEMDERGPTAMSGTPQPQPSASAMADALSTGAARWRLQRSPPASMLRNDADRHRMTTLLRRHPLNAQDLHRLTGVEVVECLVFLKVLDASKLLSMTSVAAPSNSPPRAEDAASGHPVRPNPNLARRLAQGLFGRRRT